MTRCPSQDGDVYCNLIDDDDTRCFHCSKDLPDDDPDPENTGASPWWDGFCSEDCRTKSKEVGR